MNSYTHTWLFGGGGAASWLIGGILREGASITGILDDNCSGTKGLSGIPILSPKSENITKEVKQDSVVVMAILNPVFDTAAITQRLINDGWGKVISFGYWCEEYYNNTKRCPAPISAKEWENYDAEFKMVRDLFSDSESVQVFDAFIEFVKTGKDTFPSINPIPYFPTNIPPVEEPVRMIDCGAFTGDTILQAVSLGYNIEEVHAFEPDMVNYKKLSEVGRSRDGIISWPCGVGERSETIRFQNQGDMGSFADPNGNSLIQCVKIDDCIPNFSANLIKMDIEGYEFDALKGAEELLRKYRPRLAISVYHLASDIWKIPLWISKIYTKNTSKYYLRHHSRTIADTVLYVVP